MEHPSYESSYSKYFPRPSKAEVASHHSNGSSSPQQLSRLLCCDAEDADTDSFRQQLGGAKNIPEQLFAESTLQLRHEHTGTVLRFTAKAALQVWVTAKLPPVKVLSAQTWLSTREKDVEAHQAVSFDYDW